MSYTTCPQCGHRLPNNAPHIRLHLAVSHSGKPPIVEVTK